MIGHTLAHYEILEKIGSGGMGDVYLAQDMKLDRRVALKILPPDLAGNDERRSRFEREAKTIAALNHPNIVTIHSVEEVDGVHFITMELVNGKTLAELLPPDGFSLEKFLEIAIPLADGIAAAHRAGIVHRDLKPANVMMNEDGRLKILDFGLARTERPVRVNGDSESPTALKTGEGVLAGTIHYMSPEQAEGRPVDARSDIFSLGIIFYQMMTGHRPFGGDSPAAVLASIIKDAPRPVTDVDPAVPSLLERTIRRCLAKDPSRRYQTALDIRNELEELKQDVPSGGGRRVGWFAGVLSLAIVALIIGALREREDPSHGGVPRLANPVQVTSAIGLEDGPSWSPDGGALAYHSDQGGNWDIWISQIDAGQPLNRTADHTGLDQYPVWSPDGGQIAFFSDREGGGIFVMPVFAGPARRVSQPETLARGRPQFSSDGAELAYEVREANQSFAEITHLGTGATRRVALPGVQNKRLYLSWSPGDRFFAYVDADEPSNTSNQLLVRGLDGEHFVLTESRTQELAPTWSRDEGALYFTSDRGGTRDLWRQSIGAEGVPQGGAEPVTVGLEVRSSAFSPDSARLAYSKGRAIANVWRVPILDDRPATWADAEQMTFDQAAVISVDVSPDGRLLALDSNRSGSVDLWILDLETRQLRPLTTHPDIEAAPAWSPDGREVAFYSNRGGTRDIWVQAMSGGPARRVTQHESEDYYPAWSPDGRFLTFGSTRGGGTTIWTVPSEGGTPAKLAQAPDVNSPRWSPDGEWLLFSSYGEHVAPRIWLKHRNEPEPQVLAVGQGRPLWSEDGRSVVFRREDAGAGPSSSPSSDIWIVDLVTRSERRITALTGRPGELGAIATGGDQAYFTWREEIGDLWVMDVVPP